MVLLSTWLCLTIAAEPKVDALSVLTARRDLRSGITLSYDDVLPAPAALFVLPRKVVQKQQVDKIIGAGLRVPVSQGDAIQFPFLDDLKGPELSDYETGPACAASQGGEGSVAEVKARLLRAANVSTLPAASEDVLVASRDLEKGAVLQAGDLGARNVPQRFSLPSLVSKTQQQVVVGGKLAVAMKKDDPLVWSDLADPGLDRTSDCVDAVRPVVLEAGNAARRRALGAVKAATLGKLEPLPDLPTTKEVTVVLAARNIEPGQLISEADLKAVSMPDYLVTASWVRDADLGSLVGARSSIGLIAGTPVYWQVLEGTGASTLASCVRGSAAAVTAARAATATEQAKAWVRVQRSKP